MDLKLTASNRAFINQELDKLDLSQAKRIVISDWKPNRSISANRAYQAWIPAISDELALTIPEATRYIKLTFGLPILLADEYMGPLIGEGLNSKGFFQLSYEDQIVEMERLPVKLLFNTK